MGVRAGQAKMSFIQAVTKLMWFSGWWCSSDAGVYGLFGGWPIVYSIDLYKYVYGSVLIRIVSRLTRGFL